MNIAIIGTRGIPANYGGFETCAEKVSKEWAEAGHNVLVYCRKNHYETRLDKYNNCRLKYITSIKTKQLDTLSNGLFCCFDLIFKEKEYKIVHLYNGGNALFLPLLKLFGKKVVISVDGLEWKRKKWGLLAKTIHKIGERLASIFADKVIADNKVVEDYYRTKFKIEPVLIPYGAEIIEDSGEEAESILQKYTLTKKGYFIFVGRLVPEKGVHNLIKAYNRLSVDMPLVIIGDDAESQYRNSLLEYNSDKIRFLGYIYGKEYEQLLKNALIYVSGSELEGTSPSLLAAMGAKVCTLVNGIDENISTIKDSGYYYKKDDIEDLTEVWRRLIRNPDLINEMGERGYQHIVRNYRWEKIAEDYLGVFGEIS